MNLPSDLKYSASHEWLRDAGDGTATVGITDHAQHLLGDLVFVELPEVGAQVTAEGQCGVLESVKAASDLYSPVSGEIVAVNDALGNAPQLINDAPYGDGWIFRIRLSNPDETGALLDAAAYQAQAEAE